MRCMASHGCHLATEGLVGSYASAMRCPVLTYARSALCERACVCVFLSLSLSLSLPLLLSLACSATRLSTDPAYGPTRKSTASSVPYGGTTACLVLCYALSGTDVGYAATRCPVLT
eukprot:3941732-Rhodomonas_salina.4